MDDTLEFEQIKKRVDWLEKEQRDDKTNLAAFQSKVDSLETENAALRLRLADLDSQVTRMNTLAARFEQVEQEISEYKMEASRQIENLKGSVQEKQLQLERNHQQITDFEESLSEQQKNFQVLDELLGSLETQKNEDIRLARLIEELKTEVNEIEHFEDEYKRSLKLIDENRRQDAKRLTDLQGEVAAMRKRQDEIRSNLDLSSDTIRKMENQVKSILNAESERRESQTAFIEKINLTQVERERIFKSWTERFDSIEKITENLEEELKELESTHQSVKKSQAALDEITQRFDRRINEITEMQRLNEDRFRQEWTAFKSDDQKRWSNYTIAQDEQHREMDRGIGGLGNRLTDLEEAFETVKDNLQELGRVDIKRMHTMLDSLRNSIETYNNIFKE